MIKILILLIAVLSLGTACDQSHLQQAQVPVTPGISQSDRVLLAWGEQDDKKDKKAPASNPAASAQGLKEGVSDHRKKSISAIYTAFARRTTPARAQWLAEICYEKTEGTKFTPLDLAEIALAETGGHRLSSRAVSSKGALGVWQLMP